MDKDLTEVPAPKFYPGRLARLVSGGPLMTVREVRGCQVDCIFWAESIEDFKSLTFFVDELRGVLEV